VPAAVLDPKASKQACGAAVGGTDQRRMTKHATGASSTTQGAHADGLPAGDWGLCPLRSTRKEAAACAFVPDPLRSTTIRR
jgi:hypothetical protein